MQTDVRAPGYHAERDAALEMVTCLEPRRRRRTLDADKGYDTDDFIAEVRRLGITPPARRMFTPAGTAARWLDARLGTPVS